MLMTLAKAFTFFGLEVFLNNANYVVDLTVARFSPSTCVTLRFDRFRSRSQS